MKRKALLLTPQPKERVALEEAMPKPFVLDVCSSLSANNLINLEKGHFELAFIDLAMVNDLVDQSGSWRLFGNTHLVVLVEPARIREAVKAVKRAADDYLTYPVAPSELNLVIERLEESLRQEGELAHFREMEISLSDQHLSTRSPEVLDLYRQVRQVASSKTTVLLQGETGVGKGFVARMIHDLSKRRDQPFIRVHCGAIPDNLIESELFGHERGAFTGAVKRKLGKFELARDGTIFLDEIGTISKSVQVKLLSVLQDGVFQHLGGELDIKPNVRVIAATNDNLKDLCEQDLFRKDLYYRLNVFPLSVPPLRNRVEDLPDLVTTFLKNLNQEYDKRIRSISKEALAALEKWHWPGNIRELENLIERAYILESGSVLSPIGFPNEIFEDTATVIPLESGQTLSEARARVIEHFERAYLHDLLERNRGKINTSAAEAGISARHLHQLMTRYEIRKEEYKKKNIESPETLSS